MSLCRRLSCRLPVAAAPSAGVAAVLGLRHFASRLMDALGDKVSDSVERFTKRAVFQDERMVTESRRKLERFQSAPETLAERLAAQRSVRRFLIPSDVRVDKSRQYMEFTWPEEALEAAALLEQAERAYRATKAAEEEGQPHPLRLGGSGDGEAAAEETKKTDDAPEGAQSAGRGTDAPKPWLRTRALAEYLRAYTTSTDGQYGTPKHPIYGRRGLTITDVYPVGNYALRISFSDGHTGGLYSYEYLYFLTSPENKYGLMRAYLADLRRHRKSREPPKRAASKRRRAVQKDSLPADGDGNVGVGRRSHSEDGGEGSHLAPAFPRTG